MRDVGDARRLGLVDGLRHADLAAVLGLDRLARGLERPPHPLRLTWWLDDENKIAAYLVQPLSEEHAKSRLKEFEEWAKKNRPEELAYLMTGGETNPEGDRPERWKKILIDWRKAAGLKQILPSN